MTMKESKSVAQDPIRGMTVDEASSLRPERDGRTFYFSASTARKSFCQRSFKAWQSAVAQVTGCNFIGRNESYLRMMKC